MPEDAAWTVTPPAGTEYTDLTSSTVESLLESERLGGDDPFRRSLEEYNRLHPQSPHTVLVEHLVHYRFQEAVDFLESEPQYLKVTYQNRPLLHLLALDADPVSLKRLLDLVGPDEVDRRDSSGYTPLMVSLIYDRFDNALVLLEAGANPSLELSDGDTPLLMAEDDPRMASLLRRFIK